MTRSFLLIFYYPPICTVGSPTTITPPCAVKSPCLAAGLPPINTVDDPFTIVSGGPTHTNKSPTTAAGKLPIKTVGTHGPVIGPPTCGTTPVTMGQVCISDSLAADGIFLKLIKYFFHLIYLH
jgi:hypothetical protein